jgi:hypothetical protein
MLELGGDLDFTTESLAIDTSGELGGQYLYYDPPPKRTVGCDEDAAHPPASKLALDVVGG